MDYAGRAVAGEIIARGAGGHLDDLETTSRFAEGVDEIWMRLLNCWRESGADAFEGRAFNAQSLDLDRQ